MKNLHCDNCGMMVFFQNDHCEKCGELLSFSPAMLEMSAQVKWQTRSTPERPIRPCANRDPHQVCNWLAEGAADSNFCVACALNETIPDLHLPENIDRWRDLETAKRRCLYTYLRLRLPIAQDPNDAGFALRFRFLADNPGAPVLTGHEHGLITVNIAEADGDERERRRLKLHEPYRTLMGHFRHETGHYYWDRLIANSPHLARFRELFGDENLDYGDAMKRYYAQGPAPGWQGRTVTAYASWHPWEDWAETWAHYFHIVDTIETATSFGLRVNLNGEETQPSANLNPLPPTSSRDFDQLINAWPPLTLALNSINRGMGLPDLYPFITSPAVVEKLRFIHKVIESAG